MQKTVKVALSDGFRALPHDPARPPNNGVVKFLAFRQNRVARINHEKINDATDPRLARSIRIGIDYRGIV